MSIVIYTVPLFALLILIELGVDRYKGTHYYRLNDAFGSLALGIMSRTTRLVTFSLGAFVFDYILPEKRLFEWDSSSVWTWVFTFVAYDFCYYWYHRMSHTLNMFWAGHLIHHSSEEYNLTTALRQTSTGIWSWIFYIPLLMTGVPMEVFLICGGLNLIYQFWVHTRHIKRMPDWFEATLVTPSNHRVHHAQNATYIDKNHGGVFILWDRLFGSFQDELEEEDVIFGVRRPLHSFNPITANFQFWRSLIADAWRTESWWDKCRIWFMPTGWRPSDVEAKYPIQKSDLSKFKKYDPETDSKTQLYGLAQIVLNVVLTMYFLFHFAGLNFTLIVLGFVMITLPLLTTSLMLDGGNARWELYRIILSWIGFAFAWPIMAQSSVVIFGGYLAVSSVLYTYLWWVKSGETDLAATE